MMWVLRGQHRCRRRRVRITRRLRWRAIHCGAARGSPRVRGRLSRASAGARRPPVPGHDQERVHVLATAPPLVAGPGSPEVLHRALVSLHHLVVGKLTYEAFGLTSAAMAVGAPWSRRWRRPRWRRRLRRCLQWRQQRRRPCRGWPVQEVQRVEDVISTPRRARLALGGWPRLCRVRRAALATCCNSRMRLGPFAKRNFVHDGLFLGQSPPTHEIGYR